MDNKLLLSGLNSLGCKGFKRLLDTQSLVDCTLACEGGKISAHKMVLSGCSSYLAKILLEHPVEHPIIILPELNIEDVKTLVHYMYTGELLKSNTINSISLLRTAAILSINSLNDLLLASSSTSPNVLFNSYQFTSATNNNNTINNSICPSSILQLQQDRMSFVEQISPLLAAISQQQQKLDQNYQSNQTLGTNVSGNSGSVSLNQNERIGQNLSTSSHDSNSSTNSSSFSNIIGAAAAAAASANGRGVGSNSAMAQFYNTLTGAVTGSTNAANLNSSSSSSSSSSSTSPPASQQSLNNNNTKTDFSIPEPFSYSSAITGMVTVTNTNSNHNATGSQSVAGSVTTNEFQFKCPVCHNHFQTICSFEYHMQRAHSVTSFGCEICHKPFASLRYVLTDHMRRCHGWKGTTDSTTATNNGQNNHNGSKSIKQEPQSKLEC